MRRYLLLLLAVPPLIMVAWASDEKKTAAPFDLQKAIDSLPPNGGVVDVPPGKHHLKATVRISSYCVTIRGQCAPHPYFGRAATELAFPKDVDGIIVEGRPNGKGERCSIEGLCLISLSKAVGTSVGITSRGARTRVANCGIYGFGSDGCRMEGSTAAGDNSCQFSLELSTFASCGGDGLHAVGNVANLGGVRECSFESNKGWGVREEGTYGSNYWSCHATSNKLGAYCLDGPNTYATLTGCYSEGNQPPSRLGPNCISVGGLHGAGFDQAPYRGQHLAGGPYGLRLPPVQALTVAGLSEPKQPGTAGQFVPISRLDSGKTWGWLCTAPNRWIQKVQ